MSNSGIEKCLTLAVEGNDVSFYHRGKKQTPILNGIDIHVDRGAIYGLLGPSGCGKTTLLKCVVGHWKHQSGTIRIFGKSPGESGFSIPGKGVGYMPQELALYTEFTIEETLTYFGRLNQMKYDLIARRMKFFLQFLDIPNKKKIVGNLSGGQQRRVSLAAALLHKPSLLILDEPTVGVDPLLRQSIWEHLQTLTRTEYMTVIVTTHYVEEARQANMVGLMRKGRILAEMDPEKLIKKHNASTLEEVFLKLCRKEADFLNSFRLNNQHSVTQVEDDKIPEVKVTSKVSQGEKKVLESQYKCEDEEHVSGHCQALLPDSLIDSLYREPSFVNNCKEASVRMCTLVQKGIIRLKRNIPFACFQLFIPIVQFIVFSVCIGGEIFDITLGVVNAENETLGFAQRFLDGLDNHTFRQVPHANLSLAIETVKKGEAWGAVYLGPRYSECLFDRFLESTEVDNKTVECAKIKLYLDMTNQMISLTVYAKLLQSFQNFGAIALNELYGNPLIIEAPITIEGAVYGERETPLVEFMAPGIILAITYFIALALTGVIIISEKTEGLLDRSWMAGVTHAEVMFSIMIVYFIVMVLQVTLVLIFTFATYDIPMHGPIYLMILAVLLSGVGGMANGLFISTIAPGESAALMISVGSFLPNFLASGIIWPIEGMSHWLRYVSYCLPLTLLSHTTRSVVSRGWYLSDNHIWDGFAVCTLWTAIFLFLSWLIFKYKK